MESRGVTLINFILLLAIAAGILVLADTFQLTGFLVLDSDFDREALDEDGDMWCDLPIADVINGPYGDICDSETGICYRYCEAWENELNCTHMGCYWDSTNCKNMPSCDELNRENCNSVVGCTWNDSECLPTCYTFNDPVTGGISDIGGCLSNELCVSTRLQMDEQPPEGFSSSSISLPIITSVESPDEQPEESPDEQPEDSPEEGSDEEDSDSTQTPQPIKKSERPTKSITARVFSAPEQFFYGFETATNYEYQYESDGYNTPPNCMTYSCEYKAKYPICYYKLEGDGFIEDIDVTANDTDSDGVIDGLDECIGTEFTSDCTSDNLNPLTGCFYDSDGDGLADCEEPPGCINNPDCDNDCYCDGPNDVLFCCNTITTEYLCLLNGCYWDSDSDSCAQGYVCGEREEVFSHCDINSPEWTTCLCSDLTTEESCETSGWCVWESDDFEAESFGSFDESPIREGPNDPEPGICSLNETRWDELRFNETMCKEINDSGIDSNEQTCYFAEPVYRLDCVNVGSECDDTGDACVHKCSRLTEDECNSWLLCGWHEVNNECVRISEVPLCYGGDDDPLSVANHDEDGDGVADCYDYCPGTKEWCKVDSTGCAIDNDGDGLCACRDGYSSSNYPCDEDDNDMDTENDGYCDGPLSVICPQVLLINRKYPYSLDYKGSLAYTGYNFENFNYFTDLGLMSYPEGYEDDDYIFVVSLHVSGKPRIAYMSEETGLLFLTDSLMNDTAPTIAPQSGNIYFIRGGESAGPHYDVSNPVIWKIQKPQTAVLSDFYLDDGKVSQNEGIELLGTPGFVLFGTNYPFVSPNFAILDPNHIIETGMNNTPISGESWNWSEGSCDISLDSEAPLETPPMNINLTLLQEEAQYFCIATPDGNNMTDLIFYSEDEGIKLLYYAKEELVTLNGWTADASLDVNPTNENFVIVSLINASSDAQAIYKIDIGSPLASSSLTNPNTEVFSLKPKYNSDGTKIVFVSTNISAYDNLNLTRCSQYDADETQCNLDDLCYYLLDGSCVAKSFACTALNSIQRPKSEKQTNCTNPNYGLAPYCEWDYDADLCAPNISHYSKIASNEMWIMDSNGNNKQLLTDEGWKNYPVFTNEENKVAFSKTQPVTPDLSGKQITITLANAAEDMKITTEEGYELTNTSNAYIYYNSMNISNYEEMLIPFEKYFISDYEVNLCGNLSYTLYAGAYRVELIGGQFASNAEPNCRDSPVDFIQSMANSVDENISVVNVIPVQKMKNLKFASLDIKLEEVPQAPQEKLPDFGNVSPVFSLTINSTNHERAILYYYNSSAGANEKWMLGVYEGLGGSLLCSISKEIPLNEWHTIGLNNTGANLTIIYDSDTIDLSCGPTIGYSDMNITLTAFNIEDEQVVLSMDNLRAGRMIPTNNRMFTSFISDGLMKTSLLESDITNLLSENGGSEVQIPDPTTFFINNYEIHTKGARLEYAMHTNCAGAFNNPSLFYPFSYAKISYDQPDAEDRNFNMSHAGVISMRDAENCWPDLSYCARRNTTSCEPESPLQIGPCYWNTTLEQCELNYTFVSNPTISNQWINICSERDVPNCGDYCDNMPLINDSGIITYKYPPVYNMCVRKAAFSNVVPIISYGSNPIYYYWDIKILEANDTEARLQVSQYTNVSSIPAVYALSPGYNIWSMDINTEDQFQHTFLDKHNYVFYPEVSCKTCKPGPAPQSAGETYKFTNLFIVNDVVFVELDGVLINFHLSTDVRNNPDDYTALPNDCYVEINRFDEIPQGAAPSNTAGTNFVDIYACPELIELTEYVTLRLDYTDEFLESQSVDEDSLGIYTWNLGSGDWEFEDNQLDAERNKVYATILHLSYFGIFGTSSGIAPNGNGNGGPSRQVTRDSSMYSGEGYITPKSALALHVADRVESEFVFEVENTGGTILTDIRISLSGLPDDWVYTIYPSTFASLAQKQKSSSKTTLTIPPYAPIGNYSLLLRARAYDGSMDQKTIIFEIKPATPIFTSSFDWVTLLGLLLAAIVMVSIAYLVWTKREPLFGLILGGFKKESEEEKKHLHPQALEAPQPPKRPMFEHPQRRPVVPARPVEKRRAVLEPRPKPRIRPRLKPPQKSQKIGKLSKGEKYEEMLSRLKKIEKKLKD